MKPSPIKRFPFILHITNVLSLSLYLFEVIKIFKRTYLKAAKNLSHCLWTVLLQLQQTHSFYLLPYNRARI